MSVEQAVLKFDDGDLGPVSADRFRGAMRLFAAGCTVIATADGEEWGGLTATAVCSLSAEPPLILVCVNQKVHAHGLIQRSGVLSVNILARTTEGVAKAFAGMDPNVQGADRFSVGTWSVGKTGSPVLAGADAVLDCVIEKSMQEGTHTIFICKVVDVVLGCERNPLIYYDGGFGSMCLA